MCLHDLLSNILFEQYLCFESCFVPFSLKNDCEQPLQSPSPAPSPASTSSSITDLPLTPQVPVKRMSEVHIEPSPTEEKFKTLYESRLAVVHVCFINRLPFDELLNCPGLRFWKVRSKSRKFPRMSFTRLFSATVCLTKQDSDR